MFQNKSCNLCFLDALTQFHSTQKANLGKTKIHYLPFNNQFYPSQRQWKTDGPVSHPSIVMWWVCRRFMRGKRDTQNAPFHAREKTIWSSVPSFHSRLSWIPIPGSKKGATIQRPHVCNQKMHQDISRFKIHPFLSGPHFWLSKRFRCSAIFGRLGPSGLVEIGDVTFVFWGSSKSTNTVILVGGFNCSTHPKKKYARQIGFISQKVRGWK